MAEKRNNITRYQIGDLSLDIQRGELIRNGETIALPKLSYDLLVALAQAAPALLSQAELMAIVWPDRVIGDETLKQRIKLLRKSLGDDASAPSYIEAVRGRGYRLIPKVSSECVIKQPPSVMFDLSANDQFPNIAGTQLSQTWLKLSTIVLLLFLLLGISSYFIPVLNPDKLQANEVLAENVASKDSSVELDSALSAESEEAHRYYVRGREYYHRYRKDDNDIAISLFQKALNIDSRYVPAYAALSQAYTQKYFQFSGSEGDKQQAIDNAYQALSYDNQSALAYKALGTAYYTAGWLSKSVKTLLRGKHIAPKNTEILINLAYIYSEQGELSSALSLQKLILEQEPNHAVTMLHTGITLQRSGHLELAKNWYESALSLQPDYLLTYYYLAQLTIETQDHELAKLYQNQITQLKPSDRAKQIQTLVNAEVSYYQGELKQAQKSYQEYAESTSGQLSLRATVMSELLRIKTKNITGDDNKTLASMASVTKLKAMQQQGNEQFEVSLLLAEIYSSLGNVKLAKRYLTQAIEQGYQLNFRLLQSPLFQPLRQTHYFEKLLLTQQKKSIELDAFFAN